MQGGGYWEKHNKVIKITDNFDESIKLFNIFNQVLIRHITAICFRRYTTEQKSKAKHYEGHKSPA